MEKYNAKTVRNISYIAFSNIIKLISGLVVTFIIPKILDVDQYGYYKIFTLYISYVGFVTLGFLDGIYLSYGAYNYEELPRKKFRVYARFSLIIALIVSLLIIIVSIIFLNGSLVIVAYLISFNIVALIMTSFFQKISQITGRFKEFSIRNIYLSLSGIITAIVIYLFNINDFSIYVLIIVGFNYVLLVWYGFTYKELIFGKKDSIKKSKNEIFALMKMGLPLMISNITSILIFSIDRQMVQILFDIEIFAYYSFTYSIIGMINTIVLAIGVVLYPNLKRLSKEKFVKVYSKSSFVVTLIVVFGLLSYYPLVYIIGFFLPKYMPATLILRVILPVVVFSSLIITIKHNFFKIYNKNTQFLKIGIISLIVNLALNIVLYLIYQSISSIAIATVIGVFIWSIMLDVIIEKIISINWIKKNIFLILSIVIFYFCSNINNLLIAFSLNIFMFIGLVFIFYKNYLILLINKE